MANFTPVRPGGVWVFNSILQPDEMEKFDANLLKCANFTDGSTHAPSAFVTVGGSGFQLDGTGHEIAPTGRMTVQAGGEIRLADTASAVTLPLVQVAGSNGSIKLYVSGHTSYLDVLSGANARILSGANLDLLGTVTLRNAGGPGTFAAEANTTSTWQSGATATFSSGSTVNLTGTTYVRSTMTFRSGANGGPGVLAAEETNGNDITGRWHQTGFWDESASGARRKFRRRTLTDASQTISVSDSTFVRLNNTCAADRTVIVSTVDPVPGEIMWVYRTTVQGGTIADGGIHSVHLESDTGAVLFLWGPSANKQRAGVLIQYDPDDGDWVPIMWQNLGGTGTGLFGD